MPLKLPAPQMWVPVRSVFERLPAGDRRQKEAPGEEYEPVSEQGRQESPVSEKVPAGQGRSWRPLQ